MAITAFEHFLGDGVDAYIITFDPPLESYFGGTGQPATPDGLFVLKANGVQIPFGTILSEGRYQYQDEINHTGETWSLVNVLPLFAFTPPTGTIPDYS